MPHEDKATDHSPAPDSLLDSLPARYRDAAGWRRPDPHKKRRDKFVKSNPELFCHESLFENRADRPEDDDLEYDRPKTPPRPELFGTLWRRGELTVLCGPTGVGKTILAVQLGEAIARGRRIEPFRTPTRDEVLYLDLERTRAQHEERYSVATTTASKSNAGRRTYKFADAFHHIGLAGRGLEIPEIFRGDLARYYKHSIDLALRECPARIIIIDSLASLDPKRGRAACARQLRALKLHAATHNLSILVVASTRPIRTGSRSDRIPRSRPTEPAAGRGVRPDNFPASTNSQLSTLKTLELCDLGDLAEIAQSIFALAPSTMAEDIRYIKPLKCNSTQPLLPPHQVLTYRLTRTPAGTPAGTRASLPASAAGGDTSKNFPARTRAGT